MLAFQPYWGFKPFGKQLSSEKQIKPAFKLNLEFMKQNERGNQRILNQEKKKRLPKWLQQEKELSLSPIFIAPSVLAILKYLKKKLFNWSTILPKMLRDVIVD